MSQMSLAEAATALGKSERQVRYMISTGRLKAVKIDGRWVVETTDLPLTDDQRQALARRVDAARAAFERGVAPAERVVQDEKRRHYSVLDLDTFTLGRELYRQIQSVLGTDQPAAGHMFE